MTLAIKGDENETQEYVYVDAIPDSILDELTGVEQSVALTSDHGNQGFAVAIRGIVGKVQLPE